MSSDAVELSIEQPVLLSPSDKRTISPKAAYFSDGSYVAIWNQYDSDSKSWKVTGRLFDSNNNPIGQQFFTSSPALRIERTDVEVYEDNKFIIAWSSLLRTADNWKITIQTFKYTPNGSSSETTDTNDDYLIGLPTDQPKDSTSTNIDLTPIATGNSNTISSSTEHDGKYDIATLRLDKQYIIAYMQDECTLKYEKYSIDNTPIIAFVSNLITLKRSYGTEIRVNAVPTQYYFILTYYSQLNDRYIIIRKYHTNDGTFVPGSEKSILTIPLDLYTDLSYSGNFVVVWRDLKVTCSSNQKPPYKAVMYSSSGTVLIPQSTISNLANTKLHQVFALSNKHMMATFISGNTFSAKIYDSAGEVSTTVGPSSIVLTTSSASTKSTKQQLFHRMLLQSDSDDEEQPKKASRRETTPTATTAAPGAAPGGTTFATPTNTNANDCGQLLGITVCNYDDIVLSKLFSFLNLMNDRVFKDYRYFITPGQSFILDKVNQELCSQVSLYNDLYVNYQHNFIEQDVRSLLYTFTGDPISGITDIKYHNTYLTFMKISNILNTVLELSETALDLSSLSQKSQVGLLGKNLMHFAFTYQRSSISVLPTAFKGHSSTYNSEHFTISNQEVDFDTCFTNKDNDGNDDNPINIYCFSYFFQSIDKIWNKIQKSSAPTIRFYGYSSDIAQQNHITNILALIKKLQTILSDIQQPTFTLETLEKYTSAYASYYQYISTTNNPETWQTAQQLFSEMHNIITQGKLAYINGDSFAHCQPQYQQSDEDHYAFTWRSETEYTSIPLFPTITCKVITNNQESFNTLAHELSHNAGTKDYFTLNGRERVYVDSTLCEKWRDSYGNSVVSNEDFAASCIGDFLQAFYT